MDARVGAWLSQMTTQEKCRLLGGASTWRTHAIERLGIPELKMSDGPNGVRGESLGSKRTPGVSIPVGVAIGASFDTDLALELGQLLGREAVRKSTHIVLAPTINIQRTPIGGRNFECLSEDAELTAQLATNLVRGVQHSDVCVTIKHFAGNDTERDRHTVNAQIDERTLREIYLRPFEAAVIDGEAWGLMSSYNLLNGEHTSQHFELLQQILRNEWGFDGVIVSDWFGFHDTAKSAKSGLDIAMPGPKTIYGDKLEQAFSRGEVSQHDLDARVAAVLQVILRTHAETRSADNAELSVDEPAERDLCRRAAAAGTVLVRNQNNALPLIDSQLKTIAVLGPNAKNTRLQGGGSSSMQALSRKSILAALQDRFGREKIIHEAGVSIDKMAPVVGASSLRTPSGEPGLRIDYFNNADCAGEIVYTDIISSSLVVFFGSCPVGVNPDNFSVRITGSFIAEHDGEHSVSLVVTGPAKFSFADEVLVDDPQGTLPRSDAYFGLASQEQISQHDLRAGDTRQINVTMSTRAGFSAMRLGISPPKDANAISRAVDAAANADVAVVVVGTNDEWETEGSDRDTIALPGDQDELVRRISQVAKRVIVVVNAGSPVAMPWLEDVDAVLIPFFGGMETANAVADILSGDRDPGGRLPITYPKQLADSPTMPHYMPVNGTQQYLECRNVGYRGFAANKVEPLLAFGHGLSYANVTWHQPTITTLQSNQPTCRVSIALENNSSRLGTVVVQAYVRRLDDENEPARLGAWHKCVLNANEHRTAQFDISWIAFRTWSIARHAWVITSGDYEIAIAKSSTDIFARQIISLPTYEIGPSLKT